MKTKFRFIAFVFFVASCSLLAQSKKEIKNEIKAFQKELNASYLDSISTPLRGDNYKNFKKHPFFSINTKYRVLAKFEKIEEPILIDFPTSSGRIKQYKTYAYAYFKIDDKDYRLTLYQSPDLMKTEEYKDYLFLPFRDLTNEKETYGGGKYIDLKIPNSNEIVLDFNKSYQPYCAYNAFDYSCPIVPLENNLPIEIRAGVMYNDVYY